MKIRKRKKIYIWFAIQRLNKYILYAKGFLKSNSPPKMSNEMKCTKEKMTWNIQDTNLSSYVPKANVDHTISGQGTVISTLDHLATTPRAKRYYHLSQCDQRFKTSPTSQAEIKRIGACHSSILTTGHERIMPQLTYLALFSQPIYFVNAFIFSLQQIIIFLLAGVKKCNVVS